MLVKELKEYLKQLSDTDTLRVQVSDETTCVLVTDDVIIADFCEAYEDMQGEPCTGEIDVDEAMQWLIDYNDELYNYYELD